MRKETKTFAFLSIMLLAAPLLFLFVLSCGDDEKDTALRVGIVYDIAGKRDKSFNESAYEGIKRAEGELGISVNEETTDGTDREELIRSLAETSDLVIAIGFSFEDQIKKIAAEFSETSFAGVDIQQGENSPGNFASLLFNEAEGSFLVGAAAALTTETDKVGFIGGVCATPYRIIERFEAGFIAGAKEIKPDITIKTEYLSQWNDQTGFDNTEKARMVATRMFEDGADVVFHAAGASGPGLFKAAEEFDGKTHVWAIGVDSDQYRTAGKEEREHILTSMLKRVDVAVYNIIEARKNGEFTGGEVKNDLSNGGVDYATSGGFVDKIKDLLEAYKTLIINNVIEVPDSPSNEGCAQPQTY
ncbi:MAG: BMP family ABC transporter substrate-binding protein, partial [Candidatus Dadabacteria bacterium]|nr:BMP family ABC transporter substrate-binding protein [Candidatus Dadabacteria bacterium]